MRAPSGVHMRMQGLSHIGGCGGDKKVRRVRDSRSEGNKEDGMPTEGGRDGLMP